MYYLKEATSENEDFEAFLELKSQTDAIKWSGFETAPKRSNFKKYYVEKIINNSKTHVMLLHDTEEDDSIIGYVQYDDITAESVETRGSGIIKRFQGIGAYQIMSELLHEIFKEKGVKYIETWASEKNKPSVYNLEVEGYTRLDEYEMRNLPLLGGEHRFYKWIKQFS